MAERLGRYFHLSSSSRNCHDAGSDHSDIPDTPKNYDLLQKRVDALLAGEVEIPIGREPQASDRRPFAPFLLSDKERAQALAAICSSIAEEDGGNSDSLNRAIDELYNQIGLLPAGMVEHATKLFLTHSPIASRYLQIPPLFVRQPNLARSFHMP